MSFLGFIVIGIWILLLLLIMVFSFCKAYYHFEYLRLIKPDEYGKYQNFLEILLNFELIKFERILLPLPYFNEDKVPKDGDTVLFIIKNIKKYLRLTRFAIICLLLYIFFMLLIMLFFGHSA